MIKKVLYSLRMMAKMEEMRLFNVHFFILLEKISFKGVLKAFYFKIFVSRGAIQ